MIAVVLTGPWARAPEVVTALLSHGLTIMPVQPPDGYSKPLAAPARLLLTLLDESGLSEALVTFARQRALPWLVWNMSGSADLVKQAYLAGALSVLPAEIGVETFVRTIQSTMGTVSSHEPGGPAGLGTRRHRRGERIIMAQESVLEIQSGIVALMVLHSDGSEVLLGMAGPGQLLLDHPEDSCYLQLIAHTDVTIHSQSWQSASGEPGFAKRLRDRLRQMEAWAAMQARPYLDQRVLGILSLLAEQFGVAHAQGALVDVRITQLQLASAVGANRTTITRILSDLRTRGLISLVNTADGERFCLHSPEQPHHMH